MINNVLSSGTSLPLCSEYFLERPRIDGILENAIKKPLTTIIAGTGYGKTQAVSAFLGSAGKKVVWLQLSKLDNLAMRFWERVIYGIKPYSQSLTDNLKALGYPETTAAFDKFLYLLSEITIDLKDFVIVFDDFHFIQNDAVLNFLEKLINAQIKNLSIILISRSKPNLNLNEMASKGLLTAITEDDLRFSKDEIRMYYQRQGLYLKEKIITNIYFNTEGWILAAYLMGLSLKRENADALFSASLVKVDIFKLIEKEVFALVSEKLQQFLFKAAILEDVPKKLLTELSGYDESVLSELIKVNSLMRYDPLTESYRIHNLFRDFLLERRKMLTDEQIIRVYRVAAEWYEKNSYKPEAVKYYEKCGDYNKIFDIMTSDRHWATQEIAEMYIRLVEEAPKKLIRERPIIHVVKALYLINNNKINKAHEELVLLQKRFEGLPPAAKNLAILGEVYLALALISIIKQNFDFEEFFIKADSCLPNGSALIDYRLNIGDGLNICGIRNPAEGELKKYYDAMFRSMPLASKLMNGCCFGAEYLNAADSHLMTGNIKEAEEHALKAALYSKEKMQYGMECMANFILIRIYVLKGDYLKVSEIFKQMQEQIDLLQIADSIYQYDIVKGWFDVKVSETDKVAGWIRQEEETKKLLPPVTIGREYLVRSDSLLAEGRFKELLAYMEITDALYKERGILYALIQNKITRAIIYHYMGHKEASMEALMKAYELSSPNNLIIQYIEYGNQMREVLGAAKKNKNCKIPLEWLNNIYEKSSSYSKQLSGIIKAYKADSLSDKKTSP